MAQPDPSQPARLIVDGFAGLTLVASVFSWLPTAIGVTGGCLSIIWFVIQIKESDTYLVWRSRRYTRRIERTKAALARLEAARTEH